MSISIQPSKPNQLFEVQFTSSTTWNVPSGVDSVEVLCVGGGGGGGGAYNGAVTTIRCGGGGGAGGISTKVVNLAGVSSVAITVGAGGNGGSTAGTDGSTGGISEFGTSLQSYYVFAAGGGGGGGVPSAAANVGLTGASSGGNGFHPASGATNVSAGGGGGSASACLRFDNNNPTNIRITDFDTNNIASTNGYRGGVGTTSTTAIKPFIGGLGTRIWGRYLAGGGDAASYLSKTSNPTAIDGDANNHGHGGGRSDGTNSNGINAIANTGSGGSGAYSAQSGTGRTGGNGGSGLVVVRYYK